MSTFDDEIEALWNAEAPVPPEPKRDPFAGIRLAPADVERAALVGPPGRHWLDLPPCGRDSCNAGAHNGHCARCDAPTRDGGRALCWGCWASGAELPALRSCHLCGATAGLYDCDSCGKPACREHTSDAVAYGMDWTGCDRCRR